MAVKSPFRIGRISTVGQQDGMACVIYEDTENTSAELPFLLIGYWKPKVNDQVLVGCLSSGSGSAVILGPIGGANASGLVVSPDWKEGG